ncbi:Hsp20/alpha crystallin family protein [Allosphingosinicella flava]|uniref:Hsp20/alpha crystallin family protein n=1 Tax=Allosphingosinicella flava TaxID=2771430 RepID=A0A7T2GLR6_9SPHN|nr:Hsp20/alpha crystallin family protein [Sphingosinicella flava]QPQ56117.1 Hsp20/alpha crystallin family protein [Sphingosinicella flava]
MTNRDLMPWNRDRNRMSRYGGSGAMMDLRHEMDRMLTDVLGGRFPSFGGNGAGRSVMAWPSIDVEETDDQVRITAELPGMRQEDIDLRIEDGMLMLSGERKDEREDKERGYSERYFGRFERQVALPRGVREDACDAQFKDGMLTITIPKSEDAAKGRKIEIKSGMERP